MIELSLGRHRRARIWMGELPSISVAVDRVLSRRMQVNGHPLASPKVAAVELVVPLGARSTHGLLGGKIIPHGEDLLKVDVVVAHPQGELVPNTLVPVGDEVRAGLPLEFGDAVLDATNLAHELPNFPKGHLTIECAANAAVSSSPAIFKHLAHVILRILECPEDITVEELSSFFPETYS